MFRSAKYKMAWRRMNQWLGSLAFLLARSRAPAGKTSDIKYFLKYTSSSKDIPWLHPARRLGCTRGPNVLSSRTFSQSPGHRHEGTNERQKRDLKLMDFPELFWPSLYKSIKNTFFAILIAGYYDSTFTKDGFLNGANQAISFVSTCLSQGNFSDLKGLVSSESLQEIESNYAHLDPGQRLLLCVDPRDIFIKFIHEIGIMFDDVTEKRFVEITVVFQGFRGFNDAKESYLQQCFQEIKENQDKIYVCNYRFIREFTKGVEGEWTINKLNHFIPSEFRIRTMQ